MQNNQGLSKGYPPQPSASADNPYLNLNYSGYHKNAFFNYTGHFSTTGLITLFCQMCF